MLYPKGKVSQRREATKMAKFALRRHINVSKVLAKVGMTMIALWVMDSLIKAVANSTGNVDESIFKLAYNFIGVTASASGGNTVSTTGILSAIGILAFASILLEFVKFSL